MYTVYPCVNALYWAKLDTIIIAILRLYSRLYQAECNCEFRQALVRPTLYPIILSCH